MPRLPTTVRYAMMTLLLGSATLPAGAAQAAPPPAPHYDVILRGGEILDGSGGARFKGDVAIKGGFVAAVGDLKGSTATSLVDVTGLYVTPGFINIHGHASADAMASAANMLTQGVTSEITNADGHLGTDIPGQMKEFSANGMAENTGFYTGFNSAWAEVMGQTDHRPTAENVAAMRRILRRNIDAGAFGVASGLDYRPAYYARTEEVIQVVEEARHDRTNYPNHDRLRPEDGLSSFKGVQETIAVGEGSGVAPVITHIKAQGREQGTAGRTVELMASKSAAGIYTPADVYPYLAGQTRLAAFLVPGWAADGGREKLLERFKAPQIRAQIIEFAEEAIRLRFTSTDSIYLLDDKEYLTDVMKRENVRAGEAVIRVLEKSEAGMIASFGSEADLKTFMAYPNTAIACDCGATTRRDQHPRWLGTYPRFFGKYVRDEGVMSWEEGVRRSTALPATIVGLVDRGYVAAGMRADITVLDPATIIDKATYEAPGLDSVGVRHVFVNGGQVLKDGVPTGVKSGQILARRANMPTRPMTRGGDHALSGKAASADWRVSFSLKQADQARAAQGRIELVDARRGATWTAGRLGVIQTAEGWASVTAVLRDRAGALQPVTLVVDGLDGDAPRVDLGFQDGAWVSLKPSAPLSAH